MQAVAFVFGWLVPLLIVGYVIWLLTRLTQTVERIEWRLEQLLENDERTHLSGDREPISLEA